MTSSVICVKVCSLDGATRRANPREGNGGFPNFRSQMENKLENKLENKKIVQIIGFLKGQKIILKFYRYL